jgi:hypothetical protein
VGCVTIGVCSMSIVAKNGGAGRASSDGAKAAFATGAVTGAEKLDTGNGRLAGPACATTARAQRQSRTIRSDAYAIPTAN